MIIAISGYAKSGKTTISRMIQSKQPHLRWQVKSFADKLREVATVMTGIPAEMFQNQEFKNKQLSGWNMTVREFLQKLGTDAIRNGLHKDAWVNALMADYKETDNWIVDDCRFPNEAMIVSDFGGKIIRVNKPGVGPLNSHPSETALDHWHFDFEISNSDTLEHLSKNVDLLL